MVHGSKNSDTLECDMLASQNFLKRSDVDASQKLRVGSTQWCSPLFVCFFCACSRMTKTFLSDPLAGNKACSGVYHRLSDAH